MAAPAELQGAPPPQQRQLAADGAVQGSSPRRLAAAFASAAPSPAAALAATLQSAQRQRLQAESTLHSLQAAKASPLGGAGGKENSTAAGPWRISPGHFVVGHARSPLAAAPQPQPGSASGEPAGSGGAGSSLGARSGGSAPAASGTPLSQQGSRASSALVGHLNLALRALGEFAGCCCLALMVCTWHAWPSWCITLCML